MKPENLIECLDKHGADLSRWPEAERIAAEALLRDGPGPAWKDWQASRAVDAFLKAPVAPPSRELMDRVMLVPQTAKSASMNLDWKMLLAPVMTWPRQLATATVTAALVAGVWFGTSDVAPPQTQDISLSVGEIAADAVALDEMETEFL